MDYQQASQVPPLTVTGTSLAFIRELANEISATTFVEAIMVQRAAGRGGIGLGPCRRLCGEFVGFQIRRELYDISEVKTVRDIVAKLGLSKDAFVYYRRDPRTDVVIPLTLSGRVSNRWSVLLVPRTMTPAVLQRLELHLASHREIIPYRMPY